MEYSLFSVGMGNPVNFTSNIPLPIGPQYFKYTEHVPLSAYDLQYIQEIKDTNFYKLSARFAKSQLFKDVIVQRRFNKPGRKKKHKDKSLRFGDQPQYVWKNADQGFKNLFSIYWLEQIKKARDWLVCLGIVAYKIDTIDLGKGEIYVPSIPDIDEVMRSYSFIYVSNHNETKENEYYWVDRYGPNNKKNHEEYDYFKYDPRFYFFTDPDDHPFFDGKIRTVVSSFAENFRTLNEMKRLRRIREVDKALQKMLVEETAPKSTDEVKAIQQKYGMYIQSVAKVKDRRMMTMEERITDMKTEDNPLMQLGRDGRKGRYVSIEAEENKVYKDKNQMKLRPYEKYQHIKTDNMEFDVSEEERSLGFAFTASMGAMSGPWNVETLRGLQNERLHNLNEFGRVTTNFDLKICEKLFTTWYWKIYGLPDNILRKLDKFKRMKKRNPNNKEITRKIIPKQVFLEDEDIKKMMITNPMKVQFLKEPFLTDETSEALILSFLSDAVTKETFHDIFSSRYGIPIDRAVDKEKFYEGMIMQQGLIRPKGVQEEQMIGFKSSDSENKASTAKKKPAKKKKTPEKSGKQSSSKKKPKK